jgi:hypothetical protein
MLKKKKRTVVEFLLFSYSVSLFLFCKSLFLSFVGTKERKGGKRRNSTTAANGLLKCSLSSF